jgi:hypothetical protein
MANNYGHSTSNCNTGYIITRADERTRWERELDHQVEVAAEASRGEAPAYDPIEGRYDLESDYEFQRRTRPLTPQQYREVVSATCNAQGIRYKVYSSGTEMISVLYGAREGLVSTSRANADHLPSAAQTIATLCARMASLHEQARVE